MTRGDRPAYRRCHLLPAGLAERPRRGYSFRIMPNQHEITRAVSFIDGQNLFRHAKDAFGHHHPNYDPLTRTSHHGHGLRGTVRPTEQESREVRCGASGERFDALCRPESAALRVAPRRPPAASRASTVGTATLRGPLLADRTPGHDAGRDRSEKCGLKLAHAVCGATGHRPTPRSGQLIWYMNRSTRNALDRLCRPA